MLKIDATLAQNIADEFLANEVGNLLMTGHPQLVDKSGSYWVMPVLLGNARQGVLGKVGEVLVNSNSGEIILTPKDKEKIKKNAKKLSYRDTSSSTVS